MTDTYQGHAIEILTDAAGYYARVDGSDLPLADDLREGATEADALELARQYVDRGWCELRPRPRGVTARATRGGGLRLM